MRHAPVHILAGFTVLLGAGCESAYNMAKARPAQVSEFISNPDLLRPQRATFPFDRFWFDKDNNWTRYKKIKVEPVSTAHLLSDDWWAQVNEQKVLAMKKEIPGVATYMRDAFIRSLTNDPKSSLRVVDVVDEETLVLKMALVELVPTKAFFNVAGTAAGILIPGASLVNVVNAGTVAMEGVLADTRTGKAVAMFTSREKDDMSALLNMNDFTWYGHAKKIINNWARQFVEITATDDPSRVKKPFPFTIIAL
ncbi:MAG: DUF3313 family protein [Verrucomicrobia bacterium]|nr:DUF3313 family protein [Verrucomicrobiota bacterium]